MKIILSMLKDTNFCYSYKFSMKVEWISGHTVVGVPLSQTCECRTWWNKRHNFPSRKTCLDKSCFKLVYGTHKDIKNDGKERNDLTWLNMR